jgi:cytochrome P450
VRDYSAVDFYKSTSVAENPHDYFAYLRSQGAVTPLPGRRVGLAVTGYREAIQIMLDSDHFSAVNAAVGALFRLPFEPQSDNIREQLEEVRPTLKYQHVGTADGERHVVLRSLLANLFTPSRLKILEAGTVQTADTLIDEFIDNGKFDFVADYGKAFTTLMITDLLGVPKEDRELFRGYMSDTVVAQLGSTTYDSAAAAIDKIGEHIFSYVEERRKSPAQDDILTEFALAKYPDGSEPTVQDLADLGAFLFGAGQDTTNHLMGNAMRLIAIRPELQAALRADRSLIPGFIEEVLRFDGPVKGEGRLCVKTTTVGDVEVKAGTPLLVSLMAGNRDERFFANANEFELARPRIKEHIAFGRGAHTCIGAPLARMEARVTFERLLSRLDNIRVSQEHHGTAADGYHFDYEPSFMIRALQHLHLEFDRA